MRIAVSAQGEGLDSPMDSRFGRAPYFVIFDMATKEHVTVANDNAQASGGAGVQSAQLMADRDIDVVITGNVGPKAGQVLEQSGIRVHLVQGGIVREVVEAFWQTDSEASTEVDRGDLADAGGATQDITNSTFRAAIATDGNEVATHFGHCPHYTIISIANGQLERREIIPNPGHRPGFLPKYLAELGIDIMIAGGMGINAQELFTEASINTITGVKGTIDEVIDLCILGKLAPGPSLCNHDN